MGEYLELDGPSSAQEHPRVKSNVPFPSSSPALELPVCHYLSLMGKYQQPGAVFDPNCKAVVRSSTAAKEEQFEQAPHVVVHQMLSKSKKKSPWGQQGAGCRRAQGGMTSAQPVLWFCAKAERQ